MGGEPVSPALQSLGAARTHKHVLLAVSLVAAVVLDAWRRRQVLAGRGRVLSVAFVFFPFFSDVVRRRLKGNKSEDEDAQTSACQQT